MSAIKAGSLSRRGARRVVYLLLDTYERAMVEDGEREEESQTKVVDEEEDEEEEMVVVVGVGEGGGGGAWKSPRSKNGFAVPRVLSGAL